MSLPIIFTYLFLSSLMWVFTVRFCSSLRSSCRQRQRYGARIYFPVRLFSAWSHNTRKSRSPYPTMSKQAIDEDRRRLPSTQRTLARTLSSVELRSQRVLVLYKYGSTIVRFGRVKRHCRRSQKLRLLSCLRGKLLCLRVPMGTRGFCPESRGKPWMLRYHSEYVR